MARKWLPRTSVLSLSPWGEIAGSAHSRHPARFAPRYASIVAASLAAAGPASAATGYEVFTLQDTLGNGFSQALGINDSLEIVGQDQATYTVGIRQEPFAISAAVAWSGRTLTGKELADIGGRSTTYIFSKVGLAFDVALGVNASGQAVGFSLGGDAADEIGGETGRPVTGNPATVPAAFHAPSDAVVWSAETGSGAALNDVGGRGVSVADAINNAGQIVGFSNTAGGQDAVLWSASNPAEATVLADIGGEGSSVATGVNNAGQIVGSSKTPGGQTAVKWSAQSGSGVALSDPGGQGFSVANAINDFDQVVGASTTANGGLEAVEWGDDLIGTRLRTPSGTQSDALAINTLGQIVGYTVGAGGVTDAVLWPDSVFEMDIDLGGVLGPDWTNTVATGINDEGDIVGYGQYMGGYYNGVRGLGDTAFLLVPTTSSPAPVPEPSTWAMMLLGFAGLGFLGYRHTRKGQAAAA
jgi:hypothetical protein